MLHTIFHGKDVEEGVEKKVKFIGHRCIENCNEQIAEAEIETNYRKWSEVSSWGSLGRLPLAGEYVHIQPTWNMLLDIEETPVLNLIQINGRLTFDQTKNIKLSAKHIFVRAGELVIGTKEVPYEMEGSIMLYGEKDAKHIVFDNAIEAGNKLLANVGLIQMYGKPRAKESQMTRLVASTAKGDTTITVSAGLDWVAGDSIGLLPTSFN